MQPELNVLTETVTATGTIAGYRFATAAGAQAGANADAIGVNLRPVVAGDVAAIGTLGVYPVESGGAFAVGARIMSDASGRAIAHTGTNPIIGRARTASAGAGAFPRIAVGFGTLPATA